MFWSARPCTRARAGGFALVGDLIASGCQSPVAKLAGKALPSGSAPTATSTRLSGRPAGRGSHTTALRGPGRCRSLTVPRSSLPSRSRPALTARHAPSRSGSCRPAGRFKPTPCLSGTCTVNLSWATATNSYPAVDAMAAPDGSVVIVVVAKQQAKIYRVSP